MNVPPEILVWIGGALVGQFTLMIHLLIIIMRTVSNIQTEQALQKQEIKYMKKGEYA